MDKWQDRQTDNSGDETLKSGGPRSRPIIIGPLEDDSRLARYDAWRSKPNRPLSYLLFLLVMAAVIVGLPFANNLDRGMPPSKAFREVPTELAAIRDHVLGRLESLAEALQSPIITQPHGPVAVPARPDGTVPPQPSQQVALIESYVHQLVNAEREAHGLPALAADDRLSAVARTYSLDMAAREYFAHINPEGQDPTDRAADAGYTCRKLHGLYYTSGVGENLSQAWLYSSTRYLGGIPIRDYMSEEEIARRSVQGWMNSPGHRANILQERYDRVGTGVGIAQDEKVYITQNFC